MIHPSAVIDPQAKIGGDVKIGPFAVIEGPVNIGPGCVIHSGAKLIGPMTLGARNVVHSGAVLGDWPQDRKYKGEHSELVIGDDNIFREGVTVHRGTALNSKTILGDRCYLMVNSHVGHNCVVGNDVMLVNGALLAGHVQVADRAIIGGNCGVHQFCRVGRLAMISKIVSLTQDMPPFFISMQVNRITQLNTVGLRRSGMSRESMLALRKMFQHIRACVVLPKAVETMPEALRGVPEVQEFMQFVRTTKRGVARFEAWSERDGASSGDASE